MGWGGVYWLIDMVARFYTYFVLICFALFAFGLRCFSDEKLGISNSVVISSFFASATNCLAQGKWDLAVSNLSGYISVVHTNSLAYALRGYAYAGKGDWGDAVVDFNEQLMMDPSNAVAYLNRGGAYRAIGEWEQALADYGSCLQLEPATVDALASRASIYNHQHKFAQAVQDLDRAILFKPQDDRLWIMRGYTYSHLEKYSEGLEDYKHAVQLNPKSMDAQNSLAWLYATCPDASMRNGKEAVRLAVNVCELSHWKHWQFIDTLAAGYAESDDFNEALKYEKQALEMIDASDQLRAGVTNRLDLFGQQKPYHQPADGD